MDKFLLASLSSILLLNSSFLPADAHGRLLKPPNRSSIWRFPEFANQNPPKNYNDNELLCGSVHQQTNPGDECGICGDALSQAKPRDNEIGGQFYKGIITGHYTAGQVIDVEVELTRSHRGFMEWRLCTNAENETQACFNRYLLQRADGGGSKLPVDDNNGMYKTKLKLPKGVTCEKSCVLQWNYRAGNNWGTCSNGTSRIGCGPQETFRGCADILISSAGGRAIDE